jgi:hypothetical protein
MHQDLKLGLKKIAMRATNEPKLPALTNFKSMHMRQD